MPIPYDDLKQMNYEHRRKILDDYSLKELESLMYAAPDYSDSTKQDKEVFRDIKTHRWGILNRKYKTTQNNVSRIVEVSNQFLKAWKEGFTKLKSMIDLLYENEQNKSAFMDTYDFEIKLYPWIFYKNIKTGEWDDGDDLYRIMMDYSRMYDLFVMRVSYNPVGKDENDFWNDIEISQELNWKDCLPMTGYFTDDVYLCYAIHKLWDYEHWAFQDIAKINNINIYVEVSRNVETEKF